MKSVLASWFALSVSTAFFCLAACEGDSKKSVGPADAVGGEGGDDAGPGQGTGGAAVAVAGAGGEDADDPRSGAGGMVGGAGAPLGAGGEGGTPAPTFEPSHYRGYIQASVSGTPEDAFVSFGAEFIDAPASPTEQQGVTDLVEYLTTRDREDDGADCIPTPAEFQDWISVPQNVARGASLTLSSGTTQIATATIVIQDPIIYDGSNSIGVIDSKGFTFGSGSALLGMVPDPVTVPVVQGGFAADSFVWHSTDATFPLELVVLGTPPPGAHLLLRIEGFSCRIPIPTNNADQGFIFEVPPMVVDGLPVYPAPVAAEVSSRFVQRVPVSDGWIRIETNGGFQIHVLAASGVIDPP